MRIDLSAALVLMIVATAGGDAPAVFRKVVVCCFSSLGLQESQDGVPSAERELEWVGSDLCPVCQDEILEIELCDALCGGGCE